MISDGISHTHIEEKVKVAYCNASNKHTGANGAYLMFQVLEWAFGGWAPICKGSLFAGAFISLL